jgi:hypothetical protein
MKKKKSFGKILAVYSGILLAVIAAGLILFWQYAKAYEVSRPDQTANEFLSSRTSDYWKNLIMSSSITTTPFEDSSGVLKKCADMISGSTFTARSRSASKDPDRPAYTIRADQTDIAVLTLKRDRYAGFGLFRFTMDSVKLLPGFLGEVSVEIDAPENAAVTLNGVPVGRDYITDTAVVYDGLSDLEKSFPEALLPKKNIYRVEHLYASPEAAALDGSGNRLKLTFSDKTKYVFAEPEEKKYDLTVTVPSDAEVLLNGIKLPADYVTESGAYDLLKGDEAYLTGNAVPSVSVYTVKDLRIRTESVRAVFSDGTESTGTDDGNHNYLFGFVTGKMPEDREKRIRDYTGKYLLFSTNLGGKTASNWNNLKPYLLPDGDMYRRMQLSMDGMSWVNSSSAALNSLRIEDYREFGDRCFAVRLVMNYTAVRGGKSRTSEAGFDAVFVKNGSQWLVEKMNAV